VFRHKTRKQPFVARLHTIAGLKVAGLVGLMAWRWSGAFLPVG